MEKASITDAYFKRKDNQNSEAGLYIFFLGQLIFLPYNPRLRPSIWHRINLEKYSVRKIKFIFN